MVQMKRLKEKTDVIYSMEKIGKSEKGYDMYHIITTILNHINDSIDMILVMAPEPYLTDDGWTAWELNFVEKEFEINIPEPMYSVVHKREEMVLDLTKDEANSVNGLLEKVVEFANGVRHILVSAENYDNNEQVRL